MALVSIVIPAHNAEQFLAATLESVLAQSHKAWECVVVDDDSQDATISIAERFAGADERIRVMHITRGGVSAARNAGFRATNPEAVYCTFMDSDDVWVPGALQALLERAITDPAAIGAHGVAEFIDASGALIRPGEYSTRGRRRIGLIGSRLGEISEDAPTDFGVLLFGTSPFPPGLLLVERAAYVSAGPFDESLVAGEDWEMLVRLSRYGHFAFLPDVVLLYRRHTSNAGAKTTAPRQVHLALCQNFHSPLNSAEQRSVARRGWRATQSARIGQMWSEIRSRGVRSPRASAIQLAKCGVCAVRLVRGYPRPVVRRERLNW